jgi:class 3 adenylate cyclase
MVWICYFFSKDHAGLIPKTQYVRSGDVHIAYQVVGNGPLDLIYVPGWVSHVELAWEEPLLSSFLKRLSSFSRLITFDKRGTGLSDRVPNDRLPTLEERIEDLHAVMNAAGSERAAVFGFSEGGNMCTLFAACCPHRVESLVLFGTFAKRIWSPDYPWAPRPEDREKEYDLIEREWGNLMDVEHYVPSKADDPEYLDRLATYFRRSASPGAAVALLRMNTRVDLRNVLPTICVPTLVMHRTGDRDIKVEEGRWLASQIPNARFVELEGEDHLPWVGDQDAILDEMQEFLTGTRPVRELERILTTLLFTDIVDSTGQAARLGDRRWRELLEQHDGIVRDVIGRFRGREVDTTGDGFVASFEGPARAVRAAQEISRTLQPLNLEIRAGVHTGEVQIRNGQIGGIAVHIAARVMDQAGAGEIWVSRTVKDLVAGSGLTFRERGSHALKGVPEQWQLYSV